MDREEYNRLFHKHGLNLVAFKPLNDCDEEVLRLVNAAIEAEHEACAKVCEEQLSLLKDQRVLVIQTVEKIIEGCGYVREDKDLHKDAHHLARLVMQDCRGLLMFIKE